MVFLSHFTGIINPAYSSLTHNLRLFIADPREEKENIDVPLKTAQTDQTRHDTDNDTPVPWPVPVLVAKVADRAEDSDVDC